MLFIATDLSTGGGVNKAIRDQAALLAERLGAEVTVVNARSDKAPTYPFPTEVSVEQGRSGSVVAYFRTLLRLRRRRPDFVVSSWTQDNILAVLAFLFSPARLILVEHTSWNFHSASLRLLRTIIYPLAWRVIVLNPAELGHYRRLENVRPLSNVVPSVAPSNDAPREKLILAVGHLEPRKNFADAIRAMARSGLEAEGWSLAIIGEGPEKAALNQLIAQLGLKRTTIHRPTPDIAQWFERSSLTLVTARLEVFSLVLAESMLSGVVPIAYAADGPSFILQQFPEHLVAIGDVEALTKRLAHFANVADLGELRERMRKSIRDRFSPDVIAEEWRKLLAEAPPCQ